MINIDKQIQYWVNSSKEDWDVANVLLDKDRIRHGLFLVHLTLEKIVKAHVCKNTKQLAPKIHNLLKLSEMAGLKLKQEDLDFLGEINLFNIEGRYTESLEKPPSREKATEYYSKAESIYQWLINQL